MREMTPQSRKACERQVATASSRGGLAVWRLCGLTLGSIEIVLGVIYAGSKGTLKWSLDILTFFLGLFDFK